MFDNLELIIEHTQITFTQIIRLLVEKNIQNSVEKQCNRILMDVVTVRHRFLAGGRSYPLLLMRMNSFKRNEFNREFLCLYFCQEQLGSH